MRLSQTRLPPEFTPIRLEIIFETPEDVRLFGKLVSNNVTVPDALIAKNLLDTNDVSRFKSMMSALNSFDR